MAKKRTPIPNDVAARALFEHDRTCCVCRQRGKPVQIHHLDEDPSNHNIHNLAILCLDCHRDTQIRGGFDRKLDSEQVRLYSDDWKRLVSKQRAAREARIEAGEGEPRRLELATSVAEIYRENGQYELLAMHYDAIGNAELRDKYVELAIEKNPSDETIAFLRTLQGRPDLIPADVVEREIERYTQHSDWTQRARLFKDLGRHREATSDYLRGVLGSLEEGNLFSAAYYLKEFQESGLLRELFIMALRKAEAENDLWWQVRALEELEWDSELDALLLRHEATISTAGDPELKAKLARAKGNLDEFAALRKEIARSERIGSCVVYVEDSKGEAE